MGSGSSKPPPQIIAKSSGPVYAIKTIGSRHFIIGGGGGAAKTGVPNEIELFLMSYNNFCKLDRNEKDNSNLMQAKKTASFETNPHATMNMDVLNIGEIGECKYLIAAGHDEYCNLYETTNFDLAEGCEDDIDDPSRLKFNFKHVVKFITDKKEDGGYQKTVRFDKSGNNINKFRMATGGGDGSIRIWNVTEFLNDRNPVNKKNPILIFNNAHEGDVDDIDICGNGRYLLSIGSDCKTILWDIEQGRKVSEISLPKSMIGIFKIRSGRFVNFSKSGGNVLFVTAINQIKQTRKRICYLALWVFLIENKEARIITMKEIGKESISTLAISSCGNFTAIGTIEGSVGIYNTHTMDQLYFAPSTHKIFVTGVEFLPNKSYDTLGRLPGVALNNKTSVLSLSADQTIQLHYVPFTKPPSTSKFLVALSFSLLIFYFILSWLMNIEV
uniref:Prolactin regulatory element-binding protein (inferred by orthology to a human protein) n=1 Tax=Strongyloides venezuelensis TaxID=75913 RepID=A0A0K0FAJ1_STRVS